MPDHNYDELIHHSSLYGGGEAAGSTLGGNDHFTGTQHAGPGGLPQYGASDEAVVTAQAGKTGFTGGKAKNALTGQEFSGQASLQANESDYRAGKRMVRTQVGSGSATMEPANPSFASKFKSNPIMKDKSGFPKTSNVRGEVATDYGGGDVATYYNGETNPVEQAAIDSLPDSDKKKLNAQPGALANPPMR